VSIYPVCNAFTLLHLLNQVISVDRRLFTGFGRRYGYNLVETCAPGFAQEPVIADKRGNHATKTVVNSVFSD